MKTSYLTAICLSALLSACHNHRNSGALDLSEIPIQTIKISVDKAYYDSTMAYAHDTAFVILHENNDVMFSNPDKIFEQGNIFFVLDRHDARTVVSFSLNGEPLTKYGKVGQGPGEYVSPWDVDADSTGVYILDSNSKKVIRYDRAGKFIGEKNIPFIAEGFRRLKDGNFLFNILPDGKSTPSLCVTDSMMNPIKSVLSYPEGYLGGWSTNDRLRKVGSDIFFYGSPADTLTVLNPNGEISSFMVFDFQDKSVPQKAKLDFLAFDQEESHKDYLMWLNAPMAITGNLWIGWAGDGGVNEYIVLFNPKDNKCGVRTFTNSSSVYDIVLPMCADGEGHVASLLMEEVAKECRDYDALPDSVRNALSSGDRALLIYKFPD